MVQLQTIGTIHGGQMHKQMRIKADEEQMRSKAIAYLAQCPR